MWKLTRIFFAVGVVLSVAPASGWALLDCISDAPYLTEARSWQFYSGSTTPVTIAVAARDKGPNCADRLTVSTPLGLPLNALFYAQGNGTSEVAGLIKLTPSSTPVGTYNLVYTVTDYAGNTTSVSLPVTISSSNPPNATPALDPISDLTVPVGQTISFVVGLSDPDASSSALAYTSSQTLVVDGLPGSPVKQAVQLTYNRVAYKFTFTPVLPERGVHRVNIRGRDVQGAVAIAQMRVIVP